MIIWTNKLKLLDEKSQHVDDKESTRSIKKNVINTKFFDKFWRVQWRSKSMGNFAHSQYYFWNKRSLFLHKKTYKYKLNNDIYTR
jgi:hypothetical protein